MTQLLIPLLLHILLALPCPVRSLPANTPDLAGQRVARFQHTGPVDKRVATRISKLAPGQAGRQQPFFSPSPLHIRRGGEPTF